MTEDDKIRQLFREYNPEIKSDYQFIAHLKDKLDKVEIVKQHNEARYNANRRALGVAVLAGFVLGVIMTLLFPVLCSMLKSFEFPIHIPFSNELLINGRMIMLIIMCAATCLISLNVYEIALSRLKSKV